MTNWDTLLAMIWKRTQTLNRKILVISTKNISLFMSFKNSHWLIFSSRFSYFDNFHLKTFFFFFHIHMIYKHPVTMTITSLETLLKYLILWVNSANFQGHRLTLHADLPYSDLPSNLPQFHLSCCLSRNTTDKTAAQCDEEKLSFLPRVPACIHPDKQYIRLLLLPSITLSTTFLRLER